MVYKFVLVIFLIFCSNRSPLGEFLASFEQQLPVLLDEILNLAATYTLVIGLPLGSKHLPPATEEPVPAVLFQVPPELGLSV